VLSCVTMHSIGSHFQVTGPRDPEWAAFVKDLKAKVQALASPRRGPDGVPTRSGREGGGKAYRGRGHLMEPMGKMAICGRSITT
jgi:hypothetical protein